MSLKELQEELSKKDQEIKRLLDLGMSSLDFYVRATEMRHRNFNAICDVTLEVINECETQGVYIKNLEQQLAEQRTYINTLEEAWVIADGNVLSLFRDHLKLDQVPKEKKEKYMKEARKVVEKLRKL